MIAAVRLFVSGRVQGVGYRAFVTRMARRNALRGWVRNRGDGRVEALLIGEEGDVAGVVEACRRGPPAGRVDHVEEAPDRDDGSTGFAERPTV